jgi:leader peptidase (prepilin peptidase)/N-methyltransferase
VFAACCVALGALIGALVPRIAYRLSVEYGAPPRSACAACARPFPAGFPGWVRLNAGCPDCRARLGPPWWLTATAGAGSFAVLAWALGPVAALPPYLAMAALGVLLAVIDIACLRLPDPLVGAAFAVAIGWLAAVSLVDGRWSDLGRALLAGVVSAACYLILALLPGSNLGFGDVKLAGVLGLLLGWLGWPEALLGLILPHLLNAPVAIWLLATRRAGRRTDLPLGPALLAGALLAVIIRNVVESPI